ncbi:hypothetical protein FUAX_37740 [Fulvitalea axinellae]|uniref:Plasmid pRiA4b Orf3-like domain-containing protein n=1 Tax=Fulvitalea axinellae TaxID=1182444 RepID=A0AAU9CWD2_9BACT|nr:hypothetical protein FUAX_37740 [Fulvitalea axinellae]
MILQFRIDLKYFKPPVWRRIQMDAESTFADLHEAIQVLMDWEDSHLHRFELADRTQIMPGTYTDMNPWGEDDHLHDEKTKLKQFFVKEGTVVEYRYDFGDSWDHVIKLEKILDGNVMIPVCLKGKMNSPLEDFPYCETEEEKKEALAMYGLEKYDEKHFDLDEINRGLQERFR